MSSLELLLFSALVWTQLTARVLVADLEEACTQRCAQCEAAGSLRDGLCVCVAENGDEKQCEGEREVEGGVRRVRCLGAVGSTRGALTGILGAGLHNLTARERAQEFRKRVEALRSFALLGRKKPKQEEQLSDPEKIPSLKTSLPVSPFSEKSLGMKATEDLKSKDVGEEEMVGAPNPTGSAASVLEPQEEASLSPAVSTTDKDQEDKKIPTLPEKFPIVNVERRTTSGRVLRSPLPVVIKPNVPKPQPVEIKPSFFRSLKSRVSNPRVARSGQNVKNVAEITRATTQDKKRIEKSSNFGPPGIIVHTFISPSK